MCHILYPFINRCNIVEYRQVSLASVIVYAIVAINSHSFMILRNWKLLCPVKNKQTKKIVKYTTTKTNSVLHIITTESCASHVFHLFTLAGTAHMCSDMIGCTSSISPFLFQRQELMKRGVRVHGGSNAAHTHPPGQRCFNRRSCNGVELGCFLGGVRVRTQAFNPRLASIGGPCLILHLLRQLHLETLFISPAPGPADQGHGVQVNSTRSGRSLWFFLFFLWFDPQPTASQREDQC